MRHRLLIAVLQSPNGHREGLEAVEANMTSISREADVRGRKPGPQPGKWVRWYKPAEMLVRTPDVEVRRWKRGPAEWVITSPGPMVD